MIIDRLIKKKDKILEFYFLLYTERYYLLTFRKIYILIPYLIGLIIDTKVVFLSNKSYKMVVS
jgi:hypothetical protein